MADWAWNPDTYLAEMHEEIPGYEELQTAAAAATALRVLALHPAARWVGVDASAPMLARARTLLPDADLRLGRLEDDLPTGPFDLVVSALAVHHLDSEGKRGLFGRVAAVLGPGGRFVLADLVVPRAGETGPIVVDWEMDVPSSAADQVAWLEDAGFAARAEHVRADLAVIVADLPA